MTSTSSKETGLRLKAAAESAIRSIGSGYDVTQDLRLKYCKQGERLIAVDDDQVRDVVIPGTGGILVQNVPKSINCDKGERMRFSSDVLSFQQMSEQFNHEVSLSGKIPTGHFNAAFELTGSWPKDASETKAFALDGVLITLYSIALEKSHISLCDHVKKAVPSSWDPAALARFIEKFGTHIIVGVKMGGKDVVYVKQQHTSVWQPDEVQKKLKDVADKRFSSRSGQYNSSPKEVHAREPLERTDYGQISVDSSREDITLFWRRRGGSSRSIDHHTWCQTVQLEPDVISMSFIPILSLLSGLDGSGFLTHAINLYLRYKPPIEELHQFLEFQLPKQWAPVFGELAVGPETKPQNGASLQFSFMGPRLYVNTNMVDVGNRPVTGLRLYLEGKRNNCLAIHLQHLSSMPKSFRIEVEPNTNSGKSYDRRYYEKIQWKSFSHICTVPVESDDDLSIVTGAEFEVRDSGLKRVLFLKFHFAKVTGATVVRQPEWDGSPVLLTQKSGIISTLISARLSTGQKQPPPRPAEVILNSAIYPGGPPVSAHAPKLLKFVDTSEITRGPQDLPGYWVVSGGRLMAEKGKISLRVKYSLLTVIPPEEEEEVALE